MSKRLFLLDGMALVYRAHFALIAKPIFTSKGVNSSALYGFTQTLLDIIKSQKPTHLAVAFDTRAPTQRHKDFADYKAQRQEMPEDISAALPHIRRMIEAFRIPVLTCDGYEADDIIGTLARAAEKRGFLTYMVTPDKDFGQLVDANTFLYKPARMGNEVEILGVPEIMKRWNIQRTEQVADIFALMGDASDNIPGVQGIGEKTAIKLIGEFGSVENLLGRTGELKGKLKENLEANREVALLSKRLATIICDAPCLVELETLKVQPMDEDKVKSLCVEFEFNSIGRRLFGEDFKAGRGFESPLAQTKSETTELKESKADTEPAEEAEPPKEESSVSASLKTAKDVRQDYRVLKQSGIDELLRALENAKTFSFQIEATSGDPKQAKLRGIAFSLKRHTGFFLPLPANETETTKLLNRFRPILESETMQKVGHDLKFSAGVLLWHGVSLRGKFFDTMIAHSLIDPDARHTLDYLSEAYLGYSLRSRPVDELSFEENFSAECTIESADIALQVREKLEPLLKQKGQERVFYEVESPLVSVLAEMEFEGIKLDSAALGEFGAQLAKEIEELEKAICRLAGQTFNVSSPKQLGQILFEVLKIGDSPKKTKTGQYATDEQTLAALAPDNEIVQRLLEHRVASKLKSTYADALPAAVWPKTGRIHTTYNQVMTTTGRLNSQNPNLQNIPIRTERGQEIRKAFVPRDENFLLLSADYSQIELRIIAALSREAGLLEAFERNLDVHTATAAKVFGVSLDAVNSEMRRKAKMVNYGIAYGISAFGLAQRLGIPRKEGGEIIEQYFKQFPGIRKFMDETIAFAREHGYVQTVTGRRRYIRDIRSLNHTVRSAAERNAINAPIQGSAADMIKIAMINIQGELARGDFKTRMLLQVHDELLFDVHKAEEKSARVVIEEKMRTAISLDVPIVVEIGVGKTWREAH